MKRWFFLVLCLVPSLASALSLSLFDRESAIQDYLLHKQEEVRWVSASSMRSPKYVLSLLSNLSLENEGLKAFRDVEVARLQHALVKNGWFRLRVEGRTGTSFLNGRPTQLIQTAAMVNPPLTQNRGMFVGGGLMHYTGVRLYGEVSSWFSFSAEPTFLYSSRSEFSGDATDFYLGEALGSFHIRKLVVEGGKGTTEWGTGRVTHLMFSQDSRPFLMGRIRSDEPLIPPSFLKFLGPTQFESFIGFLGKDYNFPHARIFGLNFNFAPTPKLEIGVGNTVIFGGTGAPTNNPLVIISDYFSDAQSGAANRNFLVTGRYHFTSVGIEPYFEAMMEDCCGKVLINPRDFSTLAGLFIPSVGPAGKLDFTFEWARTSHIAYRHSVFRDGFSYKGRSLGSPLGPSATGFYFASRYFQSPRFIFKALLGYEIRERLGKSGGSDPIGAVYPSYEVPDQRIRVELQSDISFLKSRLVLSPFIGLEQATGIGYAQGAEGFKFLGGFDLRYLF